MKATFTSALFYLGFAAQLSLAQENSQLFSQFAGAPTITAAFSGSSASRLSADLKICTNFLHALQDPNANPITTARPQQEQLQVDHVCQFCTSVQISRVDSCCAQASSVACFEQFAAAGGVTAPATTTGSGSIPANTKGSNAVKSNVVAVGPAVAVMLAFVGWAL